MPVYVLCQTTTAYVFLLSLVAAIRYIGETTAFGKHILHFQIHMFRPTVRARASLSEQME